MSESRVRGLLLVGLIASLAIYTRPWGRSYQALADHRERSASLSGDDLEVALVRPGPGAESLAFCEGARMAVEEINRDGGVSLVGDDGRPRSRPFRLREFDANGGEQPEVRIRRGVALARQLAGDPNIVAVLGHSDDDATPASIVYNACGVLFLTSSTIDPALTSHRNPYVFRVAPNGQQLARAMVELIPQIVRSKPVHLAVLYSEVWSSRTGLNIVKRLTERANAIIQEDRGKVDFRVVFAQKYDRDRDDPREVVRPLREMSGRFNVVLIADVAPYASVLRTRLNEALSGTVAEVPDRTTVLDLEQLEWAHAEDHEFRLDRSRIDDFLGAVARFVLGEARQRAVVLYQRDGLKTRGQLGRRLGAELDKQISDNDRTLLYRLEPALSRSYEPEATDYSPLVAEVLGHPVDYVFLVGFGRPTLRLVEQLRRAGLDRPVICIAPLEGLLSGPGDVERLGKTYFASTFDPNSQDGPARSFVERFRRRYRAAMEGDSGHPEAQNEQAADYGYAAISLLKRAFERARSASPRKASEALRLFVELDGILGRNRFSPRGDLLGLPIIFKAVGPSESPYVVPFPPPEIAPDHPVPRHQGF